MQDSKFLRASFNRAGGAFYHYLAFRYGHSLWAPFVNRLNQWLMQWRPRSRSLLIVGPSGGYSLSKKFLSQFDEVACVDPDPMARKVFTARKLHSNMRWYQHDYFGFSNGQFDPMGFCRLAQQFPHHAILFSNFLGQIPVLLSKTERMKFSPGSASFTKWQQALADSLEGRSWASYHDLFSTQAGIDSHWPTILANWKKQPSHQSSTYLAQLFPGTKTEITDHLTQELFSGQSTARQLFIWQIKPQRFHIIEGLRQN